MLGKSVNRNTPDNHYSVLKNVSGSTVTAGYAVVFDVGANVDGVRVTQASSTDLAAFAGLAKDDVANNAHGLFLRHGYYATGYLYSSTGSSESGDKLTVAADVWGLTPATTSGSSQGFGFLCEAVSASSSSQYHTTAKVFIRAL